MRRSLYTYPRRAGAPSQLLLLFRELKLEFHLFISEIVLNLNPFSIPKSSQLPSQAADREREELQVGEMDLLERNIKKGDTEEEKARKEEERKEVDEVGERKTKTQDQEPQQQGQGLSLSLANGSARYLAS